MSTTTNALNITQAGIVSYDGAGNFTAGSAGATPPIYNLGMTASGSTFSVTSADGTALSGSNKGYVTVPAKTVGQSITIEVTSDVTFTYGSSGTVTGQRWGLSTGVNWGNAMPFSLYAAINDNEDDVAFFIGRSPCKRQLPSASSIGQSGSIVNTGQENVFALGSITVADYASNPCVWLGSFDMTFVGASDYWNVGNLYGMGVWSNQERSMASGQIGAVSGGYVIDTGGTEPTFSQNNPDYYLRRDGYVELSYRMYNVNNTPAGTNDVNFVLPVRAAGVRQFSGYFIDASASNLRIGLALDVSLNSQTGDLYLLDGTSTSPMKNTDFDTSDDILIYGFYQGFSET